VIAVTAPGDDGLGMGPAGSLTRYAHDLYAPDPARRQEAARQIWLRFSDRLTAEVRRRLDRRILRRVGAEDVVQSLFASFFDAPPGPAGPPRDRAALWRLLVHFTLCKVANTAERHRARRRDYRREAPMGDLIGGSATISFDPRDDRALDPADEAVAREEFHRLLGVLPADLRDVLVMRLEGYTNAQIAAAIGRVERTVELKMKTIRALLRPHLREIPDPRGDEPTRD
jgi:RNA polymerase sigma factor (sigma-70 family)